MNFFRRQHEYFLRLIAVHEFFHLIFPCASIFFCTSSPPPPPHKFCNGPSLTWIHRPPNFWLPFRHLVCGLTDRQFSFHGSCREVKTSVGITLQIDVIKSIEQLSSEFLERKRLKMRVDQGKLEKTSYTLIFLTSYSRVYRQNIGKTVCSKSLKYIFIVAVNV